jgi:hypothetical protein
MIAVRFHDRVRIIRPKLFFVKPQDVAGSAAPNTFALRSVERPAGLHSAVFAKLCSPTIFALAL